MVIDNEPWFVGKEVAEILGYADTNQAIRKHVDDDDKLTRRFDGSGQNREMTIINE
ncbi:Bro-N domain-containing protein [Selenomonas ruminantium]|uniref:BRO-N domain-containing protein n=1 Tax=Selenomonas ruminantium TaxID=971 RepID=UPI0003FABBE5|nr:Bro-N domain-containing protein [Selenomonas ruminantium]